MRNSLFIIISIFLIVGCKSTKHLPEGEKLYTGLRWISIKKSEKKPKNGTYKYYKRKQAFSIVKLWSSPNGSLFGLPIKPPLPVRLTLYNMFYTDKEKGFRHWMMENLGQPPKKISSLNPEARAKKAKQVFEDMGHFGTEAEYRLHENKKGNKTKVSYRLKVPPAYTISELSFLDLNKHDEYESIYDTFNKTTPLPVGSDFSKEEIMQAKRILWTGFQNNGYYYLLPNDIQIAADTSAVDKTSKLKYIIRPLSREYMSEKVKVDQYYLEIDTVDIPLNENTKIQVGEQFFRSSFLTDLIYFGNDSLFNLDHEKTLLRGINSLDLFRNAYVDYVPKREDSTVMDAYVRAEPLKKYDLSGEITLNMISDGFWGPGVQGNLKRRNLFGGGEYLDFSMEFEYAVPFGVYSEFIPDLYAYSASLKFGSYPKKFIIRDYGRFRNYLPKRVIDLTIQEIVWEEWFRIESLKGTYSLQWQPNNKVRHRLNIVELEELRFKPLSPAFDVGIDTLGYILGSGSYQFQMLPDDNSRKRVRTALTTEIETGGNIFALLTLNQNQETKKVFKTQYTQFAKLSFDFRTYINLSGPEHQLAFRQIWAGVFPFGNSESVPFTEMFSIGGLNSIRPLGPRIAGPGTYFEEDPTQNSQFGEFKWESNLEYRFKMGYSVYGAVWTDIGNIWLWEGDPERPGTGLNPSSFLNEMYVSSGAGIRLDLKFLLLRVDYGAILHAPFYPTNQGWLWQRKDNIHGVVFGIGHSF